MVCQKVIEPQRCLERACPFLYAHELFGRRYVGCMQKVFAVEIDLEPLSGPAAGATDSAPIRAVARAAADLPGRRSSGRTSTAQEPLGCINPEFHELPDTSSFRVTVNDRGLSG